MPPIRGTVGASSDRTAIKNKAYQVANSNQLSSSVIKRDMILKNSHNLPTYFQLGRNSIEAGDRVFVASNEHNSGLHGSVPKGRRTNIPVQANILTRQNSAERLNLKPAIPRADSPSRRLLAKMRLEERSFRDSFEGKRLPDNGGSSGGNDEQHQGSGQGISLLSKK